MKPFDVSACLKAIDESRAAEVLDAFVRDAAQRVLDGLPTSIASTDVFDEWLVMRIEPAPVSQNQGAGLVRALSNATGFTNWKLALVLGDGVRVSVNRAAFIAHVEAIADTGRSSEISRLSSVQNANGRHSTATRPRTKAWPQR